MGINGIWLVHCFLERNVQILSEIKEDKDGEILRERHENSASWL